MLRRASASAPALALLLAALSAGGLACDDAGSNAAGGPDGSGAGSAPATADQPVTGDGLRIVSDDPAHEGQTPEEYARQKRPRWRHSIFHGICYAPCSVVC